MTRCEWVTAPLSKRPRRCNKPGTPEVIGQRRDGTDIVKVFCPPHSRKAAEQRGEVPKP